MDKARLEGMPPIYNERGKAWLAAFLVMVDVPSGVPRRHDG